MEYMEDYLSVKEFAGVFYRGAGGLSSGDAAGLDKKDGRGDNFVVE